MSKQTETGNEVSEQTAPVVGRRDMLKMTGTGLAALTVGMVATDQAFAAPQTPPQLTDDGLSWDKTFAKTDDEGGLRGRIALDSERVEGRG